MDDYKGAFTKIGIVHDGSDGLIKLGIMERHDQDRKTKITNNFVGQLAAADSQDLFAIVKKLNEQLPAKEDGEIVVGLMTSGVIMCGYLALVRDSKFNFSIYEKFGNYEDVFKFVEEHRDDKTHYLYGLHPGDSVLIVEDEVSSGNGIILLVKALRDFGVNVLAIASVIEALNFGAGDKIRQETGLELKSLVQVKLS